MLGANIENATLTSGEANNLTGNALNNTLTGNAQNNILNGGAGKDTMAGGAGDDTYVVDSTSDVVTEGAEAGTDTVQVAIAKSGSTYLLGASIENATLTNSVANNLTGNTLNNTLTGNAQKNILNGGLGSDLLIGGKGADKLTGGAGSDTFVFREGDSGQASNTDTISDYLKGAIGTGDVIDYSASLTIGGSSAGLTSAQAIVNATTGVATFAASSGTTLSDALSDIAAGFTAATDSAGEFAFFRVKNTGNYYIYISDGVAGVGANDTVAQLVGVTSLSMIDLTGGNLTILS